MALDLPILNVPCISAEMRVQVAKIKPSRIRPGNPVAILHLAATVQYKGNSAAPKDTYPLSLEISWKRLAAGGLGEGMMEIGGVDTVVVSMVAR